MAAPSLDVDWQAIRMLAVEIGVREAARRLDIDESTVMSRCAREGWLRDLPRSMPLPPTQRPIASNASNPAKIQGDVLKERNGNTRLGHSLAANKLADKFAGMDGDELLQATPALLQAGRHAAQVFGWQTGSTGQQPLRLDILAGQTAVRLEVGSAQDAPDEEHD